MSIFVIFKVFLLPCFNVLLFFYNFLNFFMFRDVPGCSGMFRHVPECSMFRVLSTPHLTRSFRASGLSVQSEVVERSSHNRLTSTTLVFLKEIFFFGSGGLSRVRSQIKVEWSENRQPVTGMLANKESHCRVMIKSSVCPDSWIGSFTYCWRPIDSNSSFVLSQCDFCSPARRFCTTWMASGKGPNLRKTRLFCSLKT